MSALRELPAYPLTLLGDMLRLRQLAVLGRQGAIATAPDMGDEALAIGVMQALTPQDGIVSCYNSPGHALARGLGLQPLLANQAALSADAAHRFIAAGSLPWAEASGLASGMALAASFAATGWIVVCLCDETLELAAAFALADRLALPLLFVCRSEREADDPDPAPTFQLPVARRFGLPVIEADGTELLEVLDAAAEARSEVCRRGRPLLLAVTTRRCCQRCESGPRNWGREAAWNAQDPLLKYQQALKHQGLLDLERLCALHTRIGAEIAAALCLCRQAPLVA